MKSEENPPALGSGDHLRYHERRLRTTILSLLRREGGMPRTAVAEHLHLSPATTSRVVRRLLNLGLLHESGRSLGSGGRTCRNIALNPAAGLVVGIEYSSESIHTVAVDFAGTELARRQSEVPPAARGGCPGPMLDAMAGAIAAIMRQVKRRTALLGVAAVDPGTVDVRRGVAVSANSLPLWREVPVCNWLGEKLNVPVTLSNTANAILSAVDRLELDRSYRDVIYIEYREGVACAIKSNGDLVRGAHGMAGEMTMLETAAERTPAPSHPFYLEESLGLSSMASRLQKEGHPRLQAQASRTDLAGQVLALARTGDPRVTGLLCKAWRHVGAIGGNLVNILDPEIVVLDPHFAAAGDAPLQALLDALDAQIAAPFPGRFRTRVSSLNDDSAPLGAALDLLDDLTFTGAVVDRQD